MADPQIRFEDGAAYEQAMGVWSRLVGEIFLEWLAPPPGLRWVDIGCGSGAFTELIVQRCAPAEVHGIDPSEGQLAFARSRPGTRMASFQQGDAMSLPFSGDRFDAAVMALVLFFVPDPAKGVAELVRVVRPGGTVAAYLWDFEGGGFPFAPVRAEMQAMGLALPAPPSVQVSRQDTLRTVWAKAGLRGIETRVISVSRGFASFEELWRVTTMSASISAALAEMTVPDVERIKSRMRERLVADSSGRISFQSTANAIKGVVPE